MMLARRTLDASIIVLALLAGLIVTPQPSEARDTSVLTRHPYPCSLLSGHPCHPTFCSAFSHHACQPDINYPIGQDLRLTIVSSAADQSDKPPDVAAPDDNVAPERRLNTIRDMFSALRGCWVPPAMEAARTGTQISIRFSFKRNGDLVGKPRVTFVTPGTPDDVRETYLDAVTTALKRCTPLSLSAGLGGALAGRPIAIRFVDDRQ
jgi:hypothetical protein